ncbi:MAG: glycosyltransferase family 4 protein [Anaerolineales bacterium]|jgi:glycosyltransferase involved in cell wall biosynthesis
MKIVCTAPSQIPSNTANSIQAMKACHALAQLGHAVTLVVPGEPPAGAPTGRWEQLANHYGLETPFEVIYIPPYEGRTARRLFPWRAVWQARRLQPDLIYTWYFQSAAAALLVGLPVQVEIHDLPPGRFGQLWYRLFLRLPGKKRQLVITQALADDLRAHYSSPEVYTVIAPNGVDLERYSELPPSQEARKQLGLPDRPTAACTGHLYTGRGVELFLGLAENFPRVQFMWVGGRTQDVDYWRERAERLKLDNVIFTGFVPNADLPRYQAAADILLMPYGRQVGGSSGAAPVRYFSSMKMFEYMAAGRPIVSSDLPVIRETLDEGSAMFCPPEDLAAWAAAVEHLLEDTVHALQLKNKALRQVQEYTWLARARKALKDWR